MLSLAWLSLAALIVVIVLSCTTAVNPGFLSMALAWVIGIYLAPAFGQRFTIGEVLAGFPTDLFLTLVGVTLLFTLARGNGTLDRVVRAAVQGLPGQCRADPDPVLRPVVRHRIDRRGQHRDGRADRPAGDGGGRAGEDPSVPDDDHGGARLRRRGPFADRADGDHRQRPDASDGDVGIRAAELPLEPRGQRRGRRPGLPGLRRLAAVRAALRRAAADGDCDREPAPGLSAPQGATLAAIAILVIGVVGFGVHVGMGAFAAAVVLILLKAADERPAIPALPWSVIVMVCGVTVLTALLEKTGGIKPFTTLMAQVATPSTAAGLMALVTGLVSVYSSTSGVVLPAFLPSVPGLVAQLGGGDPRAIASSILIGGHLVDVSPLSTIGALCIASAPVAADRRLLFNQVLAWGLSMSVVGALGCYIVFR